MHIAYVNLIIEYYSPFSGGALSTCAMQQAKNLISLGHEVSILTPVDGNPTYEIGNVIRVDTRQRHELSLTARLLNKLRMRWQHWDWPYYNYYAASVRKELKKLSPDYAICFNDLHIVSHVKKACASTKTIVYLQNEAKTRRPDLHATVADVDAFICVSSFVKNSLIKGFPVPESKAFVLLNGADQRVFVPSGSEKNCSSALEVLYVGRVNQEKAPDIVVDAVAKLRAEGLDINLTVAGSVWWYGTDREMQDPYFNGLAKKISRIQATRLGHVDRNRMPEVFRAADVVVIPSRWNDPCPLVIAEAMNSGCAVIASNRGGIPEACGNAALIADPDDPSSFVEALRRVANDRGLLLHLKRASRQRGEELTWSNNTNQLLSILSVAGQ